VQDRREDRWRFVVGLGNPGRQYARTRHNVGFRVLEALRRRWGADDGRSAFGGKVYDARPSRPDAGPRRVLLLEPHTYMNCSGRSVREAATFYKAAPDDLLIVLDDMNLPLGRLRARAGGSAGGQKGLADILQALGTQDVPRLRIGIGPPPGRMDGVEYVLSSFGEDEREEVDAAIEAAAEAAEDWVFRGLPSVMGRYNRKPDDGPAPAGDQDRGARPGKTTESDEV